MDPISSKLSHVQYITTLGPRDQGAGGGPVNIESIDAPQRYAMVVLLGCALWNSFEMVPIVLLTFKRYSGLYFWSVVLSTVGVVLNATGFILIIFDIGVNNKFPPGFMAAFGWVPMVAGQSLVLFSRLHLLRLSRTLRKWILGLIISTTILVSIPTLALTVGSQTIHPDQHLWVKPYQILERIQVVVFFLQEVFLSSLYLWKCFKFLVAQKGSEMGINSDRARRDVQKMFVHLLIVNAIVIGLDATIIGLQYSGLFLFQISYKPFAYSVKLKMEASILTQLVDFVRTRHRQGTFTLSPEAQKEWDDTLERVFATAGDSKSDNEYQDGVKQKLQTGANHTWSSEEGTSTSSGSGTAHTNLSSKGPSIPQEMAVYPARYTQGNPDAPFVRWWHPAEVKEVHSRRQSQRLPEKL
ncbi:integral membrane protein [Diaporthe helianthi]|uniref:Integral membrane protein n=1 Tax=Diaporthe helianthi TaxID=158607 RepID=A0A2P5HGV6_DIAHE|nr:integral membrane protein [Diaporthe helianthi]